MEGSCFGGNGVVESDMAKGGNTHKLESARQFDTEGEFGEMRDQSGNRSR
jgi:hypothetical protein